MKVSKFAAFAALGLLSLASCSEDQSTFNVEDVPGRCLIQGVIKYNEGTTIENGHFCYNYKPASNLEVVVTVNNSTYGNLQGSSTFVTTTDEEGNYKLEIPVPATKTVNASISTADFRGVRTVIESENNQIVTATEDVIYRGLDNVSVHGNGIVYKNIICTECSADEPIVGMTQLATLKGKIGQGVEYKIPAQKIYNDNKDFIGYNDASIDYVFDGAKADMIIDVYYNNNNNLPGHLTYNVTSNAEGEWTLQVPVKSFPASFRYSITAMPYDSNYTHYEMVTKTYKLSPDDTTDKEYIDYEPHTLQGFYKQNFNNYDYPDFPVAGQIYSSDTKLMVFYPYNNGQDLYNYNSYNYSQSCLWLSELLNNISNE